MSANLRLAPHSKPIKRLRQWDAIFRKNRNEKEFRFEYHSEFRLTITYRSDFGACACGMENPYRKN